MQEQTMNGLTYQEMLMAQDLLQHQTQQRSLCH
jgi:hypothetical protein